MQARFPVVCVDGNLQREECDGVPPSWPAVQGRSTPGTHRGSQSTQRRKSQPLRSADRSTLIGGFLAFSPSLPPKGCGSKGKKEKRKKGKKEKKGKRPLPVRGLVANPHQSKAGQSASRQPHSYPLYPPYPPRPSRPSYPPCPPYPPSSTLAFALALTRSPLPSHCNSSLHLKVPAPYLGFALPLRDPQEAAASSSSKQQQQQQAAAAAGSRQEVRCLARCRTWGSSSYLIFSVHANYHGSTPYLI